MSITYSKLLALVFILILSSCKENVTPPPVTDSEPFIRSYGKERSERAVSVRQDFQGNIWISGYSNSYSGSNDIFLMKCNQDGSVIWSKSYSGIEDDIAAGMELTNDGGCIIIGTSNSFGSNGSDIISIKIDNNGNIQWSRIYKILANDYGLYIKSTVDGGFIVGGTTEFRGAGNKDALILKLNQQGLIMWGHIYAWDFDENAVVVKETNDNGFIITGITNNTGFNGDILLLKVYGDGVLNWAKSYGGDELDEPSDLVAIPDGTILLSGFTRSFGLSSQDCYFLYLNSSGEIIRSYTIGSLGADNVHSVSKTVDNGFIACGSVTTGTGSTDALIIKFFGDIQYNWSRNIGLQGDESALNLIEGNGSNLLLCGYTNSIGSGESEIYLINLNPDGTGCYNNIPENLSANEPLSVTNDVTEFIISVSLSDYDSSPALPVVSDIFLNITEQCKSK